MKISFIGDISFSGIFSHRCILDQSVHKFLAECDVIVINLEGNCTDNVPQYAFAKGRAHPLVSPAGAWQLLKSILPAQAQIVVNLCNNHTFDAGTDEVFKTIKRCIGEGWHPFGAGRDISEASTPVIIERDGKTTTLLAVAHQEGALAGENTPGVFSDSNAELIKEKIITAKKNSDCVIVNYHGGEEFTFVPLPPRRNQLREYIEWGADIVIAHHPHVVQGYEKYKGKYVFYSLGNFVFDTPYMHNIRGTEQSVVVKLEIADEMTTYTTLFTEMDRKNSVINSIPQNKNFAELTDDNYDIKWHNDSVRLLKQRIHNLFQPFSRTSRHVFLVKLPATIQKPIRLLIGTLLVLYRDLKDYRYKYLWIGCLNNIIGRQKNDSKAMTQKIHHNS